MLCPRCHAENREDRRFCSKCAAPLAVVCVSCGFTNDPGDEFCGGCAQSLRAGTSMPSKLQSPERYTPKHLSKSALEGERKQVTVLFADLKGSMELLADRDPEEARKLLDPVLERMMEAVHRYEGTVNQVMGDGIIALEDLHWIDGETQTLLDGLVDSLGSARLLLLVNYRPEYEHPWGGKTSYSQMRLDALPAESARELLEALLGEDPGLAPLKQLLVKRGNPFFLEETVRTLVETKALAGERGRYRLIQPAYGQAAGGSRVPHDRDDDVPRDGHAVLVR
jgi:hypothetical protein